MKPNSLAARRLKTAEAAPSITDEDDFLIVTARLASGKFESEIRVPLHASKEEKERFVDTWLALMQAGLSCGTKKEPAA